MHITDVLGWTGCTFLTVNIIPQIYKIRITNCLETPNTQILYFNFKREYLCAKVNCNIDMESCNYALKHNT